MTQLLPIPTAAKLLSVSPRTLWRIIERGDLPVVRLSAGCTRVDTQELEEYIRSKAG